MYPTFPAPGARAVVGARACIYMHARALQMCVICKILSFLTTLALLTVGVMIISKQRVADEAHGWDNPSFWLFTSGELMAGFGGALLFMFVVAVASHGFKYVFCGAK